jgi:hypothetical protein
MHAKGIVRLELAARLTAEECDALGASAAHKTKLLASAARLMDRLRARGRAELGPGAAADGAAPVYAAAAQLHYDADTGEFWDEGGAGGAAREEYTEEQGAAAGGKGGGRGGGRKGGGGGGGKGGRGKGEGKGGPSADVQRRRAEQSKARLGNHSRKEGAARKQRQ